MSGIVMDSIEIVRVSVSQLRPHPAAADVPKMSGPEWALFLADVGRRGVQEPLVVLAGSDLVLDGRHRLDAAALSGAEDVPVRYIELDEAEVTEYVIRAALCRRHLNESQRALLAARISTVGRGKRASDLESANLHFQTVDQTAEILNVSPRSVMSARKVLANGHAALAEAIAAGDMSVSAASKLADLPPDEQRQAVAGGKQAVRNAVSRLSRKPPAKPDRQPKLDLPALKKAFLSLSEDDRMAFLDWVDHEAFAA